MTPTPKPAPVTRSTLTRFLLHHLVGGSVGALVFLGVILVTDFAGLRTLMSESDEGWLYLLLLAFGLWATFGSVAMAVGVMRARDD